MPRKSSKHRQASKRDSSPPRSSGYHQVQLQSGVSPEGISSIDQAVANRRNRRTRPSKYLEHPRNFNEQPPTLFSGKGEMPPSILLRRHKSKLIKVDPPTVPHQATSSSCTPLVEIPSEWREPITPLTSSKQHHPKFAPSSKPSAVGDQKFNAELSAALSKRKVASLEPSSTSTSGYADTPAEWGQTTPMTSPQSNQKLTSKPSLVDSRPNFSDELFAAVQKREAGLPLTPHPSHASTTLSFTTTSTRHTPSPLSSREPITVMEMGSRKNLAPPPLPPKRMESFLHSFSNLSTPLPTSFKCEESLEVSIQDKNEENTTKWDPFLHVQCLSSVANKIANLPKENNSNGDKLNEIDDDEWETSSPEQKTVDAVAKMTSLRSSSSSNSKPLTKWTVDDVSDWLRSFQFDDYVTNFSRINGAQLAGLKEMELVRLGMRKPSHINLLKSKLEDVRYNS